MPLYIIFQCCKCHSNYYLDLWTISPNHKYSFEPKYVCCHFDMEIDHESNLGFFGLGWSNQIIITAYNKYSKEKKIIIDQTFNKNHTEYEKYGVFSNKYVCHVRISQYKHNHPISGFNIQEKINYMEMMRQRL